MSYGVTPVISYGAAVWGTKQFSCINAVHHRAMRFFLGTGKYTPNVAVQGEMGWKPIIIYQWKSICNHWSRCLNYDNSRVNKSVFLWALSKGNNRCKNWSFIVKDKLNTLGLHMYTHLPFSRKKLLEQLTYILMELHVPVNGLMICKKSQVSMEMVEIILGHIELSKIYMMLNTIVKLIYHILIDLHFLSLGVV